MLGRLAGNSWPTAVFGLRGPSERRSAAAWQGFGPRPTWPSNGRAKGTRLRRRPGTTAARRTRGRALPGHGKPREGAHKGCGGRAVLMRERRKTEVERFTGAGTSSDELGHGRAGKKTATTASHLVYGSHTRAQLKGLDEAELPAGGIGERGAGGGANRRWSDSSARW